jgi:membrane associated rhomboid family serine protease
MIQDQRKAQLEAAVGKAPDTVAKERSDLIKRILGYGALFLLIGGICLLWGMFYFPAACAVAGYTGSFAATLNPTVGLDTIRRLGFDYVKILLMTLLLAIMSMIVSGVIGIALSAFDMPGVGNVPAKAIASLFGFYIAVVFSCVIGFALYKGAERLKLYQ